MPCPSMSGTAGQRRDPHGCGTCSLTDHGIQVRTGAVLGTVGVIDTSINVTDDGFKVDLARHTRGDNLSCFFADGGLVPA